MHIEIRNNQNFINIAQDFFSNICSFVLEEEKKGQDFEISILLVNNEEMQDLNLKHRNKNKPTDVLSFPMWDEDEVAIEGIENLLGDIVISVEQAIIQAKEHNLSPLKEIAILLIHGMLHLLGYDHEDDGEAEKMEGIEKEYLEKVIKYL